MILLVIYALVADMPVKGNLFQDVTPFADGWTLSDGTEADFMQIPFDSNDTAILTKEISSEEINSRSICFISRNMKFSFWLDDTEIYDFSPDLGGIGGKYYGDYVHTVAVPMFSGTGTLSVRCECLTLNSWTGLDGMILQDSGKYLLAMLRENMLNFLVCLTAFLFGAGLFCISLLFRNIQQHMTETLSLGTVTMVLSLWSNAQNRIIPMITGNPAAAHVLDYLALMIIPIPILIFISLITQDLKRNIIKISVTMSVVNTLLQFGAVLSGRYDYHDTLWLSHILIAFDIALVIYLVISSRRKQEIDKNQMLYLVGGLGIVLLGGILDMIRYYLFHTKDSSTLSRIGLIIFIIILSVYEFRRIVSLYVNSSKAEIMHELAVTDALTGMKNRTAFTEYEQDLIQKSQGCCLFIHLDVNHLKKVNDTYGHAAGDKHILAAANVIQNSFGESGHCFRVGGDEFFVIMDGKDFQNEYQTAKEKFRQMQQDYNQQENPPVPLAIAHGVAEYDYAQQNPEAAERLADTRMYENKRSMKKAPVI